MAGPHSTDAELENFIADCTKRLAGPLNNVDRGWLYEDRREARAELARRKGDPSTAHSFAELHGISKPRKAR